MWNRAKSRLKRSLPERSLSQPDPLAATGAELEVLRGRLAGDMEDRRVEMERFKEETLWRLDALSDRTIEIARVEERNVETRIAQDKVENEARLDQWKAQARERLLDEKTLDALTERAMLRLLPSVEKIEKIEKKDGPENFATQGGDTP
jgi:hypothetical protein